MLLFFVTALAPTALAGEPTGHYHPDDVAAASEAFARAQAVAGTVFAERSEQSSGLAAALRAYEEALDLLGDAAPEAQRARLKSLEKTFQREYAVVVDFANQQVEGFDAAFLGALERALGDREAVECKDAPTRSGGLRTTPRFGAAPAPAEPCPGDDLNASLAAAMDADEALSAELDTLLQAEWPTFTLAPEPQPAIGADQPDHTVDILALVRSGARDTLAAIRSDDEAARVEFEAAAEQGASPEELSRFVEAARAITARTAARRAALAEDVIAAAEKRWAKARKKGGPTVAWCAQPERLGGCEAEPLPRDGLQALMSDKKVSRALEAASAPPR